MHNSGGVISQPGIAKWLLSTSYKCWVTLCTNSPFVRGDPPRETTGSTKVLFWNSFVTVNSTVTMIFSHYLSKNMTLNFSSNWVQIKSSPCKWIFPPGTAYWEYHLPPSPWLTCQLHFPAFSPGLSLVAKSPCVCVLSYFHINTATQPSHRDHRWYVERKQHWMKAVGAKCPSRALLSSDIVNHHYLIIIPVTLWLSIPVMTIVTSCQPCSGMICPDNPELVTRYWQGPGESPGPGWWHQTVHDTRHQTLDTESRAGKSVDTNVWSVWEQSLVWIISNTQL